MCGYCGKPLNPGLIDRLRNEFPDIVVTPDDKNNPGSIALVNADEGVASGDLRLQDEGISFRTAESSPTTDAWGGDDAFVFNAPVPDAANGAMTSLLELRLSSLMDQEISSMSSQSTETPDTVFWTYNSASSFEDWLS